jgi:hypothetical protein
VISALISEESHITLTGSEAKRCDRKRKELRQLLIESFSIPIVFRLPLILDTFCVDKDRAVPQLRKRLNRKFFTDPQKTWTLTGMEDVTSIKNIPITKLDGYIQGLKDKTVHFEEKF